MPANENPEDRLARLVRRNGTLCRLRKHVSAHLSSGERLILVGGVLRNLLSGARPARLKDIDLMVTGVPRAALKRLPGVRFNYFGGTTFRFENTWVDLWRLEDTYHIRRFRLPVNVRGFLSGAPFNLDKICFVLPEGRLEEQGCIRGLREAVIRYVPKVPYLEGIQAARCILLRRRTGFRLDGSARRLLRRAARRVRRESALRRDIREYVSQQRIGMDADGVLAEIRAEGEAAEAI